MRLNVCVQTVCFLTLTVRVCNKWLTYISFVYLEELFLIWWSLMSVLFKGPVRPQPWLSRGEWSVSNSYFSFSTSSSWWVVIKPRIHYSFTCEIDLEPHAISFSSQRLNLWLLNPPVELVNAVCKLTQPTLTHTLTSPLGFALPLLVYCSLTVH